MAGEKEISSATLATGLSTLATTGLKRAKSVIADAIAGIEEVQASFGDLANVANVLGAHQIADIRRNLEDHDRIMDQQLARLDPDKTDPVPGMLPPPLPLP